MQVQVFFADEQSNTPAKLGHLLSHNHFTPSRAGARQKVHFSAGDQARPTAVPFFWLLGLSCPLCPAHTHFICTPRCAKAAQPRLGEDGCAGTGTAGCPDTDSPLRCSPAREPHPSHEVKVPPFSLPLPATEAKTSCADKPGTTQQGRNEFYF